jgi:hypothetical protein
MCFIVQDFKKSGFKYSFARHKYKPFSEKQAFFAFFLRFIAKTRIL